MTKCLGGSYKMEAGWGASEASEPAIILEQAFRSAGVFPADRMVDWRTSGRIYLKVESSLDQIAQIQVVGNVLDDMSLTTNIGAPIPCPANGNISMGLDWDDWNPFIGIIITILIAPTVGRLKIWYSLQG